MLDIATLTALATSAVAVLTPLVQKAVEKGPRNLVNPLQGRSSTG